MLTQCCIETYTLCPSSPHTMGFYEGGQYLITFTHRRLLERFSVLTTLFWYLIKTGWTGSLGVKAPNTCKYCIKHTISTIQFKVCYHVPCQLVTIFTATLALVISLHAVPLQSMTHELDECFSISYILPGSAFTEHNTRVRRVLYSTVWRGI